jgi:drug/metabolite transporter (DMT)-like permease
VRVAALLLALTSAVCWGVGGILIKKGTSVVSPATILAFQYALGILIIGTWILARRDVGESLSTLGRRWPLLLALALLQIGGYVAFVVAVKLAGGGAVPTTTIVAIAATYPALVAVLSGPVLGESLQWNDAVGVALIISGVVMTQVL